MKIALVGEALSGFGGMETVIRDVVTAMQNKDCPEQCKVFFFCRNDKMDKEWLKDITYTCFHSNIRFSFLRRIRQVTAFSQWLRDYQPDVVIGIDVLSCMLANKARNKSGIDFSLFSWPHFSLEHKKHADCIVYADYHLAISSGIKKQMLDRGIPEDIISLVYNPVSMKNIVIPAPVKRSVAQFLYIGRMKFEGQKRIKDLLDGLSQVQGKWQLHVIGDGSDFEKCKNYAVARGIADNIIWYGWQKDPWNIVRIKIREVDALLLTSSFEGFPITLLEAMSYGIPCISSDCMSGPRDMIIDGVNGFLYPPGDVAIFSKLLQKQIDGENYIEHQDIPVTINRFYENAYFDNFHKILTKKYKKKP